MNLVVLAAGKGTRLGDMTKRAPKVAVRLPNDHTLLEYHVQVLEKLRPIERMLLVCGFGVEKVEKEVARIRADKPIHIVYNPFYGVAGPIASVWMARSWMTEQDFLLCNGDTYYSEEAVQSLLAWPDEGVVLGVGRDGDYSGDSMNVDLQESGRLRCVGKHVLRGDSQGVSAGLLLLRGHSSRCAFVSTVERMLRQEAYVLPTAAWHSILNELVQQGVCVETTRLEASDWHEVDTMDDVHHLDDKLRRKHPMDTR